MNPSIGARSTRSIAFSACLLVYRVLYSLLRDTDIRVYWRHVLADKPRSPEPLAFPIGSRVTSPLIRLLSAGTLHLAIPRGSVCCHSAWTSSWRFVADLAVPVWFCSLTASHCLAVLVQEHFDTYTYPVQLQTVQSDDALGFREILDSRRDKRLSDSARFWRMCRDRARIVRCRGVIGMCC